MEEDIDNSNTDTISIPVLDIERRTSPVKCLWCNTIAGYLMKTKSSFLWVISRLSRNNPSCEEFLTEQQTIHRS